jgi:hypothetical protein
MLRFYDRGHRHLHLPEVSAVHMKDVSDHWTEYARSVAYRRNARNWSYIAAKQLRARDAIGALVAVVAVRLRDGVSVDWRALRSIPGALAGFAAGLRRRAPVRPELSRAYRLNLESFASPWWFMRPPRELVRALPRDLARAATGRATDAQPLTDRRGYYEKRERYYPRSAATLQF